MTRSPELALCDLELKRSPVEIDFRAALARFLGVPEDAIDVVSTNVARLLHTVNGDVLLATVGGRHVTVEK